MLLQKSRYNHTNFNLFVKEKIASWNQYPTYLSIFALVVFNPEQKHIYSYERFIPKQFRSKVHQVIKLYIVALYTLILNFIFQSIY